jgi:hypothetical protein
LNLGCRNKKELSIEAHNKRFKQYKIHEIRKCEKQRINWKFQQNNNQREINQVATNNTRFMKSGNVKNRESTGNLNRKINWKSIEEQQTVQDS